jgi:hypothetical protein
MTGIISFLLAGIKVMGVAFLAAYGRGWYKGPSRAISLVDQRRRPALFYDVMRIAKEEL